LPPMAEAPMPVAPVPKPIALPLMAEPPMPVAPVPKPVWGIALVAPTQARAMAAKNFMTSVYGTGN